MIKMIELNSDPDNFCVLNPWTLMLWVFLLIFLINIIPYVIKYIINRG